MPDVKGEGTHWLWPGVQRAIILDVRTTPRSIATQTGTKDLQNVNLSLRVLSHPALPHLADLYKTLGTDYAERVLPGICNEVLKAVVAQYDAEELITLRDQVSRAIRVDLAARAKVKQAAHKATARKDNQRTASKTDDCIFCSLPRSQEFHIVLDDVSITHLNFSKDYSKVRAAARERASSLHLRAPC